MSATASDQPSTREPRAGEPARAGAPVGRYAVATLAVGLAFAATALTWPLLRSTPWACFFCAVMFSAWSGGLGPAALAIALGAALGDLYFLGPYGPPGSIGAAAVATLAFVGVSGFISFLSSAWRRSEAEHARQRGWFEATVACMGDALIATDPLGLVRLMNPLAEVLTGRALAEAAGRPLAEVFRPLDEATGAPAEDPAARALRDGVPAEPIHPLVLLDGDGRARHVEASARPIRDARGAVLGVVLVLRDISERRAAAAANARIVRALDNLTDSFWRIDRHWRFIYVNDAACRESGLPRDRLLGRTVWEAFPEAAGSEIEAQYRRALAGRTTVEYEHHYEPLGRWFEIKVVPEADGGLAVLSRDITERKWADQEIRRLNRELAERVVELQTLLEILPVGVWQADPACERITGNRAGYAMLGLPEGANVSLSSPEARAGRSPGFRCLVDGREVPPEELPMQRAGRTGRPVFQFTHESAFDDGRVVSLYCNVAPLLDAEGRVRSVLGAYIDITALTRAQEALRASEERFRLAAEALNGLIYESDLATGRMERSRGLFEVLGYRPEEVPDTAAWWFEQVHPDDLPRVLAEFEANAGDLVRAEYRVRHRDGRWLHVEDRAVIARDRLGRPARLVGCTVDVTERTQAEAALEAERELLQTVIDRIPVMIALYGPDARVLRLNPEFARVTGWTAAEAAGASLMERVYPDPAQRREAEAFMRDCPERWMDLRMRTRDGRDVETSWANVRLSDRTRVGIGLDLTERRRTEDRVRRLAAIIEATPDFVGVAGPDGRLSYLNRAGRRLIGLADDADVAALAHGDLCPPWVVERAARGWLPEALRRGSASGEGAIRTLDGREVPASFVLLAHRDAAGAIESFSVVARDITAQLEAEAALKEADRRKDEFLATLAHELRNPMAPIRNAVQILKASPADDPDLELSRTIIDRQAAQMARLLDDLLDVSRITREKLELRRHRVALAAVVEAAVETSRPLIEAAGHELAVALPDGPVYLDADPVRLAQVFSNLLNNAAKYTPAGGHVRLEAARLGDALTVTVRDDGIGLAPEILPTLFDMFSQAAPALERAQGGLGIGLSLVKGLVELHGGAIEARSDGPGRGSAFVVRLPVADGPAPEPAAPEPAASCDAGCRILVADDSPDAAGTMARLLQLLGHEVRTAADGQEAVEAADAFRPDVALLDIGMPRLNGYDAARRIRELPGGAEVTLVALTGWGSADDRRRSREAGFDAHLTKPVDPQALRDLLASVAPRGRP
jgi:PAS domain S-box-containing protein